VLKSGYTSAIFVDMGAKVDGTYYCVTCFCHNSCCLSYVMSGHAMLSDIIISYGSVATLFRCGVICNNVFIANFLLSVTVKNFENRSLFGEAMDKSLVSCFLLCHDVQAQATASMPTSSTCNHNVNIKRTL